ncbi:MAG TPA: hypothetical protein VJ255_03535 [Candidatus Acidoferrum sp.]|nr:hypothetical protein [Candidatus Acidoferrum sp.]
MVSVAASAAEPSFRTLGAGCEGLVVAVTVSSLSSRFTPKTNAALHAAASMDADATILTIETGVITIIRGPTDRYQQYELILRRSYLLIKSG